MRYPQILLPVLSQIPSLKDLDTIFAIPEHKVALPGGARPSQNDVWILAETPAGLVSISVEGKVSKTVQDKMYNLCLFRKVGLGINLRGVIG